MKLEQKITLTIPSQVDPATKNLVKMDPYTTDELKVIYLDNPSQKQYYVSIHPLPAPIMLFEKEEYHDHITKEMAREKIHLLSKGDIQFFLQDLIPKTLEDDPYGPGTILSGMFSALGIKSTPTCSCRRHAIEMNTRGVEWCENNLDTIIGWLKEETEKRKLPWVETIARMIVNRAITKSKRYREAANG